MKSLFISSGVKYAGSLSENTILTPDEKNTHPGYNYAYQKL
jgi:hypothetical protein